MPKDNVERAIKKGTGELEGTRFEEIIYEGYGPGGVAVFIQTLSDNRNRITAEIRHLFGRYNGNMGESGCVAWMFQKKGYISISGADLDEDKVLETALEAGAEDVKSDKGSFEVFTAPNDLEPVREALIQAGIPVQSADITMLPKTTVKLDEAKARTMLKLMDAIEDLDDVQNVYANFDIDASVMETIVAA
jgi:YebC/PmpR family DNA-binding regulatory protein